MWADGAGASPLPEAVRAQGYNKISFQDEFDGDALDTSKWGYSYSCFDPNARPSIMGDPKTPLASIERFIALSDVVKVSDEDIDWLTGGASIDEVVERWLGLGPSLVVVTRGKHGCLVATASGLRFTKTPGDVTVVDTVGAGDSFMGGLEDGLWSEDLVGADRREALRAVDAATLERIMRHAAAIADITVSRAGANPPTRDELP